MKYLLVIVILVLSVICFAGSVQKKDIISVPELTIISEIAITDSQQNTVSLADRRRVWKFLKLKKEEEERQREEEQNEEEEDNSASKNPGLDEDNSENEDNQDIQNNEDNNENQNS